MAELKDKKIKCNKCGKEFIWTAEAQEFFKKHNLSAPKRCLLCRKKKQLIAFLVKMLWPPKELTEG